MILPGRRWLGYSSHRSCRLRCTGCGLLVVVVIIVIEFKLKRRTNQVDAIEIASIVSVRVARRCPFDNHSIHPFNLRLCIFLCLFVLYLLADVSFAHTKAQPHTHTHMYICAAHSQTTNFNGILFRWYGAPSDMKQSKNGREKPHRLAQALENAVSKLILSF